jgi:hypothetical protein
MSKHTHHQSMAEQIVNKGHASAPFHYDNTPDQANKTMGSGDIQTKPAIDNNSIQLRAYQIYQEKGGSDLENWLEAERILSNRDQTVSRFIKEGNSNSQR